MGERPAGQARIERIGQAIRTQTDQNEGTQRIDYALSDAFSDIVVFGKNCYVSKALETAGTPR